MKRSVFFQAVFLLMVVLSMMNTGCSTWNKLIGQEEVVAPKVLEIDGKPATRYSETPTVLNPSNRNYRKMTRSRMEEESDLGAQAGSMWVMEGQGAYLFSQNKSRREGDLLNVKVEGPAQKQIETKVGVIKKLLKQLEEEELRAKQPPVPVTVGENSGTAPKAEPQRAPAAEAEKEKDEPMEIGAVPTRIVERQADGNYRIKGSQPFMIGKREYKVIVTGLVRPEDYNDDGISSNKILDPQFDVVSIRRSQQ